MKVPPMERANIKLLDVDKFIKDYRVLEVTSNFMLEPASDNYHNEGLFSELIFGELGTEDRFYNFGYINLKTKIFAPKVFEVVKTLKKFYNEIMAGTLYAVFDDELKDFVPVDIEHPDADTGYNFFIDNFSKIKFEKNTSIRRNDKINLLNKFKDNWFINKMLIIPAGYRDFQINEYTYDEINNYYNTLLNYAKALPNNNTTNPIYDTLRYATQRKVNEIYAYIKNLLGGKRGFIMEKYSKRKIALGTTNVLSATDFISTAPDDPRHLSCDETYVPLYQGMKMFQPLLIYNLKTLFFNQLFDAAYGQTALIDIKTLVLEYIDISLEEKNKFITSDGLKLIINNFRHTTNRFDPVTVYNEKQKYFLYLVYAEGNNRYLFRNVTEFQKYYEESTGKKYHQKNVHPLTYIEMFYIATYAASIKKHTLITRYPVLGMGSTYPSKVHLISTDPCETVYFQTLPVTNTISVLPNYPLLSSKCVDSLMIHTSRYRGLGADCDGDSLVGKVGIIKDNSKLKIVRMEKFLKFVDCTLYETKTKDAGIVVEKYKVKESVKIESINKQTGLITWEPITEFSVHKNLEMYHIKSKKKQFKKFWASADHSLIIYDKVQNKIRECSPKELLESPDNKFLIQK